MDRPIRPAPPLFGYSHFEDREARLATYQQALNQYVVDMLDYLDARLSEMKPVNDGG